MYSAKGLTHPRTDLVGASQGVHLHASDPAHPVVPGPLQWGEVAKCLLQLDEIHHAIVEYQAIGATVALRHFEGQSAALAALAVKTGFEA